MSKKKGEPEWDAAFEPLMKLLQGKKGIKTKSASEVAKRKVEYFRGRDFKKFVLGGEEILKKKCSLALKEALEDKVPSTDKDVEALGAELIQRGFCYRAMDQPINTKTEDKKPKKWPDRLGRTPQQNFDLDGYYVITYEGGKGWQHFMLGLLITGVLLACMFPAWPIWAKIGVWYLSVIFLILYFGVLIIRMVIYTIFWIPGFDFWIFPNLNDEYCGFLDSFQPVYSWEKRKDDFLMLVVRFGSLAMVAVAVEQISQTTSLTDVQDFLQSSYLDVIDWGVEKLTALPGSDRAQVLSIEELKKQMDAEDNATSKPGSTAPSPASAAEDDGDVVDVDQGVGEAEREL